MMTSQKKGNGKWAQDYKQQDFLKMKGVYILNLRASPLIYAPLPLE